MTKEELFEKYKKGTVLKSKLPLANTIVVDKLEPTNDTIICHYHDKETGRPSVDNIGHIEVAYVIIA